MSNDLTPGWMPDSEQVAALKAAIDYLENAVWMTTTDSNFSKCKLCNYWSSPRSEIRHYSSCPIIEARRIAAQGVEPEHPREIEAWDIDWAMLDDDPPISKTDLPEPPPPPENPVGSAEPVEISPAQLKFILGKIEEAFGDWYTIDWTTLSIILRESLSNPS